MADALPEFGFLSSLVGVNFAGGMFLTVEGINDASVPGALNWVNWNAPASVPVPTFGVNSSLVNSSTLLPSPSAYLNVRLTNPVGDPNPGLNITPSMKVGNVAWAYPRPSYLKGSGPGSTLQGIAFFNLSILAPMLSEANLFAMTLQQAGGSDLSPLWTVRVALWKGVTNFVPLVKNGALVSFAGAVDVKELTGQFNTFQHNQLAVGATDTSVTLVNTNP